MRANFQSIGLSRNMGSISKDPDSLMHEKITNKHGLYDFSRK